MLVVPVPPARGASSTLKMQSDHACRDDDRRLRPGHIPCPCQRLSRRRGQWRRPANLSLHASTTRMDPNPACALAVREVDDATRRWRGSARVCGSAQVRVCGGRPARAPPRAWREALPAALAAVLPVMAAVVALVVPPPPAHAGNPLSHVSRAIATQHVWFLKRSEVG